MARGLINKLISRSLSVAGVWQRQQLQRPNVHKYQLVVESQILAGGRGIGTFRSGLRGGLQIAKLNRDGEMFATDCRPPFSMGIGGMRYFSEGVTHFPVIVDPDIQNVFKDLMAASWDELPDTVIHDAKRALSKNTEDKAGQEALENVFCAAEAVEQYCGILVSLRMEIDDSIGLSGEVHN